MGKSKKKAKKQEKANRLHVRILVITLAIAAAGLLAILLGSTILRNWFIISFGVRAHRSYIRNIAICVGVDVLYGILQSIPLIQQKLIQRQELERSKTEQQQRSQALSDYAADTENPQFVRRRLSYLREEYPDFSWVADRCIEQMDRMDRMQFKQRSLIQSNDARYLYDTIPVFDDVERRLCRNYQGVINICITAESSRHVDIEKINVFFEDNDKKLQDAQRLLELSADWVNNYIQKGITDSSSVESWIRVINNSLMEG